MFPRRHPAPCRALLAVLLVLGAALAALPHRAAAADDPVLAGFDRVWVRTDLPTVRGDRTFLWGPEPVAPMIIKEPMAGLGLPNDERSVLYWDKARMEVNAPTADPADQYYVTNGLLVSEMVTGQVQVGINPVRYAGRAPAEIPFGDLADDTGPTYRSFGAHLNDVPLATGQPVAQTIDRAGNVSATDAGDVTCQTVVPETRHCIAAPFWDFLNSRGPVLDFASQTVVDGALFDPLFYATGLPISEPYWITVRAAGRPTRVLIQLFERRTLTYNPANLPTSRVEMGNVGLQYYTWRYTAIVPDAPPTGLAPEMRAAIGAIWDADARFHYLPGAVAGRYQLLFQNLDEDGAYGFASRQHHLIAVDRNYTAQPRGAGIILVHEMQHASDFNVNGGARNAQECYAFELRGFLTEAYLWQTWYGTGGKADTTGRLDREENSILKQMRENPAAFVAGLIKGYTDNGQCPGYPKTGTPDRMLTTEGLPTGIADALPVDQLFAMLRGALADDGGPVAALTTEDFVVTPR
jgi:hypothetical protein